MYEFAKINVREIFGHNRIAKIIVRENYQKQENLGGKTSAEKMLAKFLKIAIFFTK